MHRNNSFTTHSSEDSIYSSIKKQFSVNVIELYYDSIDQWRKKMSLHRKCLSLFPLVTSIYTVEKNMRLIVLYD